MIKILLVFIFTRPFISSLAFPYANFLYFAFLLFFLSIWVVYKGIPFSKILTSNYPLTAFCSALVISIIFSKNELNSLQESYKYISGLLLFLITLSLVYKDKILITRTLILAGFIVSLLAIYQYFFGFKHTLNYMLKMGINDSFALDYISRRRVFFPFATPNILAGYLAMIIPLSLTMKKDRWIILPLSFALLLTKSLGALLSMVAGLTIYFYLQGKLKRRKGIIFALLIALLLIAASRSIAHKQHTQPIFSTIMRWNYWKDTLAIIKAFPLTGVGLGNFNLTQSRFAHNSYLQIFAEMGILGIISFLWLVISVLNRGLKTLNGPCDKTQVSALIAAATIFLIHNLVDFTFFLPEVALIWWVILGLIVPGD